jgi:hypothetical protein
MRRLIRLSVTGAIAALASLAVAVPSSAAPEVYNTHVMHARGSAQPAGTTSNLLYHGGAVETQPLVYIDYWGSKWANGFASGGYTSAQAQTYINYFFGGSTSLTTPGTGGVGGTNWITSTNQYCQGTTVNSSATPCTGTGAISNSAGELKGIWNDTGSNPSRRPTTSNVATEALNAVSHFGYHANATYFVFLPSGSDPSGFGTQWCAWHSETNSSQGPVAFANMPYQPDAGRSCGENFVNATNTTFGNGYFDGFSVVGGHEYGEAETDPNTSASSVEGWLDSSGSENGDKCAWSSLSTNLTIGSNHFAVQPLWSNQITGCYISTT